MPPTYNRKETFIYLFFSCLQLSLLESLLGKILWGLKCCWQSWPFQCLTRFEREGESGKVGSWQAFVVFLVHFWKCHALRVH